jgi:hypothetical protein
VTVERATPLPPPPIQHRPETPIPWTRPALEAVPAPIERDDITGRIQVALAHAPRPRLELGTIIALVALVGGPLIAAIVWWADVRDGLRDRPTRQELREELSPLRQDVRAIERLLDRRLPPERP